MATYLPPVEHPSNPLLKLVYLFSERLFGKVTTGTKVFAARMPVAFLAFYSKTYRLDRKLKLPSRTAMLIREHVATTNGCLFCMDTSRYFAIKASPDNAARYDALPHYRTSPLISEAERAALDYATELTRDKEVDPGTFARLRQHFSEREVCDIVWLVASEHLANLTNIGLNIGSDGLCEINLGRVAQPEPARRVS